AHDQRATLVLQGPGHDLARRSGAGVDQHDHRHSGGYVAAIDALRLIIDGIAAIAPALRDDLAFAEEQVAQGHGFIQRTARVAPQVQDQASKAAARLAPQALERGIDVGADIPAEFVDADHADLAVLKLPGDRFQFHHAAYHADVEQFVAPGAHDRQADGAAGRAAHLLHRLVQFEAVDQLAFDMGDEIAGL